MAESSEESGRDQGMSTQPLSGMVSLLHSHKLSLSLSASRHQSHDLYFNTCPSIFALRTVSNHHHNIVTQNYTCIIISTSENSHKQKQCIEMNKCMGIMLEDSSILRI